MYNMAMGILVQVFCGHTFLLSVYPAMKLLVHRTFIYSVITAKLSSKIVISMGVLTAVYKNSSCFTSLPTFGVNLFSFKHSNVCIVVSSFSFHFSDNEVEHLLKYLLTI